MKILRISFISFVFVLTTKCRCSEAFIRPFSNDIRVMKNTMQFPQYFLKKHRTVSTPLFVESSNNYQLSKRENSFDPLDLIVVAFPPIVSCLAFASYPQTATIWNDIVSNQSGLGLKDGGQQLLGLVQPALTGPIGGLVSILFSVLVSMTVSTLYERQESMRCSVAKIFDNLQLLTLHSDYFPVKYKTNLREFLNQYAYGFLAVLEPGVARDEAAVDKIGIENAKLLGSMMRLLNDLSEDEEVKKNQNVIEEAYTSMREIIDSRSGLQNVYSSGFPLWHYLTLSLLGGAICVIFLVLTNNPATRFLALFQLRLCWTILIGSFSMLSVVLYDLNLPFEGTYQLSKNEYMYKLTPEALEYVSEKEKGNSKTRKL